MGYRGVSGPQTRHGRFVWLHTSRAASPRNLSTLFASGPGRFPCCNTFIVDDPSIPAPYASTGTPSEDNCAFCSTAGGWTVGTDSSTSLAKLHASSTS